MFLPIIINIINMCLSKALGYISVYLYISCANAMYLVQIIIYWFTAKQLSDPKRGNNFKPTPRQAAANDVLMMSL